MLENGVLIWENVEGDYNHNLIMSDDVWRLSLRGDDDDSFFVKVEIFINGYWVLIYDTFWSNVDDDGRQGMRYSDDSEYITDLMTAKIFAQIELRKQIANLQIVALSAYKSDQYTCKQI